MPLATRTTAKYYSITIKYSYRDKKREKIQESKQNDQAKAENTTYVHMPLTKHQSKKKKGKKTTSRSHNVTVE